MIQPLCSCALSDALWKGDVGGSAHTVAMTTVSLSIDHILQSFFRKMRAGPAVDDRERFIRVEPQLRRCLNAEAERILPADKRTIYNAEREFDPQGAFARTMAASELIVAFLVFLEERWLLPDERDQRMQLNVVRTIAGALERSSLLDAVALAPQFRALYARLNRLGVELDRAHRWW
ncbi:MAG: hypothetical protein JWQ43_295 [Glaciihabitans sp.]|nr:hypothetical protein [Glaciihabitans sp.]